MRERKSVEGAIAAVLALTSHGVTSTGITGAYHARRLAPLRVHHLRMWEMAEDANVVALQQLKMAVGAISNREIAQRIKDALRVDYDWVIDGIQLPTYPIPDHPPMRPNPGCIDLVGCSFPLFFCFPVFPTRLFLLRF